MNRRTIALIDADMVVRRAVHGGGGKGGAAGAVARFDAALDRLLASLKADAALLALSDARNFRKRLWPDYKAARLKRPRPPALDAVKAHARAAWAARSAPGLEADDVLGIWATAPDLRFAAPADAPAVDPDARRIVVSDDKDLGTVPGLRAGLDGRLRKTRSALEADRAHLTQTLTGDASDGYRGCPGVGPKTADRILAGPVETWWPAVRRAFADAREPFGSALLQARLARILRHGEVDADGRPRLWTPERINRRSGSLAELACRRRRQ